MQVQKLLQVQYIGLKIIKSKIDWEDSDSQSKPVFSQRNESTNENAIKHQEDLKSKVIKIFEKSKKIGLSEGHIKRVLFAGEPVDTFFKEMSSIGSLEP